MNPEAFFWLLIAAVGSLYLISIVASEVAEWREAKRVRRILKGDR